MKFIDQTEIFVKAGKGGAGSCSFKTARNKPKLGPDGGNGGPPMSKGTPGRDHWGNSMFCLMGGGGIKGGRLIGSTTKKGDAAKDRPVTPSNIHATVYECMGIDPKLHILDHAGRPTPVLEDPTSIHELF